MLHLEPRYYDQVVGVLKNYHLDGEVWAFGSRVSGERFKSSSDLDLVLVSEQKYSLSELAKIKETFSESDLPFKVDISLFHRLPSSLQEQIVENHIVLKL